MKKWIIVGAVVVVAGAVAFYFLTKKKDVSGGLNITEKDAVCIIDGVALRDAAGSDAKFIATLNAGEKLICLDTKEVKEKKYIKVELKGGNTGWIKESVLVIAAKPAVVVKEAIVYQRPDLITKTNKILSTYDLIAIKEKQGDFVMVYGRTKDGKRVSGSWIKLDAISMEEVDVAVAIYVNKAYKLKDVNERMAAIKEIVDNSDFSNSCFMTQLSSLTTAIEESEAVNENVEVNTNTDSLSLGD